MDWAFQLGLIFNKRTGNCGSREFSCIRFGRNCRPEDSRIRSNKTQLSVQQVSRWAVSSSAPPDRSQGCDGDEGGGRSCEVQILKVGRS